MKKVRDLTPRMQKLRETIQAYKYNVGMSFVNGTSNHKSDVLSRSPVGGGSEEVEGSTPCMPTTGWCCAKLKTVVHVYEQLG